MYILIYIYIYVRMRVQGGPQGATIRGTPSWSGQQMRTTLDNKREHAIYVYIYIYIYICIYIYAYMS